MSSGISTRVETMAISSISETLSILIEFSSEASSSSISFTKAVLNLRNPLLPY